LNEVTLLMAPDEIVNDGMLDCASGLMIISFVLDVYVLVNKRALALRTSVRLLVSLKC